MAMRKFLESIIRWGRWAAIGLAATIPMPLAAQGINSISSAIDNARDTTGVAPVEDEEEREDDLLRGVIFTTAARSQEKLLSFAFITGAALDYDTNPARAQAGSSDAARFQPFAIGSLDLDLRRVTITAEAGIVHANYSEGSANDKTLVPMTLRLRYGDADANDIPYEDRHISPYVAYAPTSVYGDFLSNHLATVHDVTAGLSRRWASRNEAGAVRRYFRLDLNYQRRHSTVPELEEHRPSVTGEFFYRLPSGPSLTIGATVMRRMFTNGLSEARDDWNVVGKAGFEWVLDPGPRPRGVLSLNLRAERNDSDQAGSSYWAWNVGPVLKALFLF
jgi:hypothetical protein